MPAQNDNFSLETTIRPTPEKSFLRRLLPGKTALWIAFWMAAATAAFLLWPAPLLTAAFTVLGFTTKAIIAIAGTNLIAQAAVACGFAAVYGFTLASVYNAVGVIGTKIYDTISPPISRLFKPCNPCHDQSSSYDEMAPEKNTGCFKSLARLCCGSKRSDSGPSTTSTHAETGPTTSLPPSRTTVQRHQKENEGGVLNCLARLFCCGGTSSRRPAPRSEESIINGGAPTQPRMN